MASPAFDIVAGHTCLDFTNTVNHPDGPSFVEKLHDFADLAAWSEQAGVTTPQQTAVLVAAAADRPNEAARVLARAIELREAIYGVFGAALQDRQPPHRELSILEHEWAQSMQHRRLCHGSEGRLSWDWRCAPDALDRVLWRIALGATELLTGDAMESVAICGGERCSYLFLDTSKNHRRRWCDMKVCGNRAKVRRHRAIQRRS